MAKLGTTKMGKHRLMRSQKSPRMTAQMPRGGQQEKQTTKIAAFIEIQPNAETIGTHHRLTIDARSASPNENKKSHRTPQPE